MIKLNNDGGKYIYAQCKTRYKSNVVKLIQCYDDPFNLEKSLHSLALLFWQMAENLSLNSVLQTRCCSVQPLCWCVYKLIIPVSSVQ